MNNGSVLCFPKLRELGAVMPYDTKAIANYFLDLAQAEGKPLSPMKLQKLVYFAHGWYLGLTGKPLLDEAVQAWSFGPVIQSLYKEFLEFGACDIDRIARTRVFTESPDILDWKWSYHEPSLKESSNKDKDFVEHLLKRIWEVYSGYSAAQLSNLTHEPGSPWDQVSKKYNSKIPKYETIPEEAILSYFQAQGK
jgi:uncharacterized phage-associated protein